MWTSEEKGGGYYTLAEGQGTDRLNLIRVLTNDDLRPALKAWKRAPQGNRKKEQAALLVEETKILSQDQVAKGLIRPYDTEIKFKDGQDAYWYALRDHFKMYVEIQKLRRETQKTEDAIDLTRILKKYKWKISKEPRKDDLVLYFNNTSSKLVTHIGRFVEISSEGAILVRSKFAREMPVFLHPVGLVDAKYGDFFAFYTPSA